MCLLCIPHAKDFLVCYCRGFFLEPQILQPLDKVCFEYRCLACFKSLYCITFGLLAEPDKKRKAISFYLSLLARYTYISHMCCSV